MFRSIALAAALVVAPFGHYYDDEPRCYGDECEAEDEGGRRKDTCFMFCDNIIIIPGLPGIGGGGQENPPEA